MQIITDKSRIYLVGKVKDLTRELSRLSQEHHLVIEVIKMRQH